MLRSLLLLTLAAMTFFSHAIEELKYEIVQKIGNVELRQYAPYTDRKFNHSPTSMPQGWCIPSLLPGEPTPSSQK